MAAKKSASEGPLSSVEDVTAEAPSLALPSAKSHQRAKGKDRSKAKGKIGAKKATPKSILVIVESPAKARTIEKYLGSRYTVLASMGHLIDLPKSRVGIDVEGDFEPEYLTIRGKAKLLKSLQKAAKKSCLVLLASDNDREGEAIAFHIQNSIRSKEAELPIRRIVFNEITPQAIRNAVKDAARDRRYQGRRPEGAPSSRPPRRLQSFAAACGKRSRTACRPAACSPSRSDSSATAKRKSSPSCPRSTGASWAISARAAAPSRASSSSSAARNPISRARRRPTAIVDAIQGKDAVVGEIREAEKTMRPKPPFTTSKLQQTAANRLGFTSKKTMQIAQQLYEGVNVGSDAHRTHHIHANGLHPHIRYRDRRGPRLSSRNASRPSFRGRRISTSPTERLRMPTRPSRPTIVAYDPESMKEHLSKDQLKLYALIWERFVASQMTNAKVRSSSADIVAGEGIFRVVSSQSRRAGLLQGDQARRHQGRQKPRAACPELQARRGDQARARPIRAALHSGPLALHRRVDHQGARGTGHRPSLDLCAHHLGAPRALLRLAGESPARAYNPRADDQRYPGRVLSRSRQRRIHRGHGGDARRGRGREGRLGAQDPRFLRSLQGEGR